MNGPEFDPRVTVETWSANGHAEARDYDPEPFFQRGAGFHASDRAETTLPQLTLRCAADLAGREVPARRWLVPDLVPDRAVTMLSGDGGVSKSLLALQLGVGVANASEWVGTLPDFGEVLYLSAEDDEDELHRRLVDIAGDDLKRLANLHLLPLAGKDAVLGSSDGRGLVAGTPLLQAVTAKVAELRPRLVIIDNLADAFSGNENSRPEARQFVGLMRGLAIEYGLAIILISHPSLSGLSSGTGTSGSTAWSNSVRSRLYLDRAKSDDGDEPDPALRILRLMKANYAPTGTEINLRWEKGRFKLDGSSPGMFDRIAADTKAERVFMHLLRRFAEAGRDLSPKRSPTYAPTVFAKQPDAEGCNRMAFEKAMERLFSNGKIKVEQYGPPSRIYTKIAVDDT